jgi:hypothetical protein
MVPAWSDRRISPTELGVTLAVATVSTLLFVLLGGSYRRLVGCSLFLALGSLVILDRFSLPRIERDGPTRDFFARVQREVGPTGVVYSYRLNENVLGRACLDLHRPPVAEDDWRVVTGHLRGGGAYLLAEVPKVEEIHENSLTPMTSGVLEGLTIALYSERPTLALNQRTVRERAPAVLPSPLVSPE